MDSLAARAARAEPLASEVYELEDNPSELGMANRSNVDSTPSPGYQSSLSPNLTPGGALSTSRTHDPTSSLAPTSPSSALASPSPLEQRRPPLETQAAQPSLLKRPEVVIGSLAMVALALCGIGIFLALRPTDPKTAVSSAAASPNPTLPVAENGKVAALGRIEPAGGLIQLAAPSSGMGGSARVARLMVKEGDRVKAGQPLALLDSYEKLRAEALQAQAQVREAEARVAKVKAGSKASDIGAQVAEARGEQASVIAKQAEVRGQTANAEAKKAAAEAKQAEVKKRSAERQKAAWDLERYDTLFKEGAIAESQLVGYRLALQTSDQAFQQANKELEQSIREYQQAQATLAQTQGELAQRVRTFEQSAEQVRSVRTVRPEDVREAESSVQVALANLERAKAELANAVVIAPAEAQVLKIHTDPGEAVGDNGILELGRTTLMDVVAEVYETDVGRVRTGQRAIITGAALPRPLTGKVYQIGLKVAKNDVLKTDPAADTDSRIVEVKIRLDDATAVSSLTNLQVNVELQ